MSKENESLANVTCIMLMGIIAMIWGVFGLGVGLLFLSFTKALGLSIVTGCGAMVYWGKFYGAATKKKMMEDFQKLDDAKASVASSKDSVR